MLANASNNDRWGVRAVGALPWFQHPILFRKKVQTHRISEYDLILISCFCGLLQKSFVDWVKIHLSMMTSMMFEELYYEIRCKCNDFRANFGWMVQSFRWKWCSDFGIMAHRLRMNGALFYGTLKSVGFPTFLKWAEVNHEWLTRHIVAVLLYHFVIALPYKLTWMAMVLNQLMINDNLPTVLKNTSAFDFKGYEL